MARVEQSIEVNVSPATAYALLTRFEQYPRFMQGVQEVRRLDDRRLRWHIRDAGIDTEWDAEITQQVPEQCIAWRRMSGPRDEARIELRATDGECTRVTLQRDRDAAHGGVDSTGQDLVRFKQFIEKLGRDSGDWRGRDQEGAPTHSASAELAAGGMARPTLAAAGMRASDSLPEQPDAPQQPFGADDADNAHAPSSPVYRHPPPGRGRRLSLAPILPGLFGQRWQDPLSAMRRVSDSMEQVFTVLAQASGALRGREDAAGAWSPRVETFETPERLLFCIELPGIARSDIALDVRPGRLLIDGVRQNPAPVPEGGRRCSEFRYGRFYRVLTLPEDADTEAVSAELRNGVLQVTVLRRADRPGTGPIEISEG